MGPFSSWWFWLLSVPIVAVIIFVKAGGTGTVGQSGGDQTATILKAGAGGGGQLITALEGGGSGGYS